jgi:hypothetical protein
MGKTVRNPATVSVLSKDLSVNCQWICELLCRFECHQFLRDHAAMLQAYHVWLSIFGRCFGLPGVLLGPHPIEVSPNNSERTWRLRCQPVCI